jgi:alkylated DNA repair dioxygenase AlkB
MDFITKKINFLSEQQTKLFHNYCVIRHRNNFKFFDDKQTNNCDTYYDYDPLMESYLSLIKPKMEKETELQLLPTYAFWRMYTWRAKLLPHTDREECEISVTINIGSCGTPWPFWLGDESNKFYLNPGEGIIYKGTEQKHGRPVFEGDCCSQMFLHYVNKNGKYADRKWDKRLFLGFNQNEISSV